MGITRRGFLQLTGSVVLSSLAYEFSNAAPAMALNTGATWKLADCEEQPTICCYCSGGCGTIGSSRNGELINMEGDPDHPVNRGGLCSKGSSQFGVNSIYDPKTDERIINPNRLTKPRVRRPGASEWEEISWEQAIEEIAAHVKKTRDETFETTGKFKLANGTEVDGVVNRTEAIASLGGAALDNEECYALQKLVRAWGATYVEHQARI